MLRAFPATQEVVSRPTAAGMTAIRLGLVAILAVLMAAPGGWAKTFVFVDKAPGRHALPDTAPAMTVGKAPGVTSRVCYKDLSTGVGIGFDDPVYGQDRQDRVEEAVDYFASAFEPTGACNVLFESSEIDGAAALPTMGVVGLCIVVVVCIVAGALVILRRGE